MTKDIGSLNHYRTAFNSVGWFIPPYRSMGYLSGMAAAIQRKGAAFSQQDLESLMARLHTRHHLAAMITERYAVIPHVREYRSAIAEGVTAHFQGLNRAAVNVLLPVIEGAGKRMAASRGVKFSRLVDGFPKLAEDCKKHVIEQQVGAIGEIVSMLEAFAGFARQHLYVGSESYSLSDKTNRHGILHGEYTDADYGHPISVYKAIGAIDFLCFVSTIFSGKGSFFSPEPTERSILWAKYFEACQQLAAARPTLDEKAAA